MNTRSTSAPLERLLRIYPKLLLLAVGASFVFVILAGDGSSTVSGRVGGDYPAFYTAGTLILDDRVDELYDPVAQAEVQDDLLGGDDGYLAFAYPPHVAAAYAPLAALTYRTSYVVHTLAMVAALIAGLQLLRPLVGIVDRYFALVLAATVTSYPMFMALGGGQNTALTFLLLAAVWRALADDRELAAGLAAGLLLFRPQYGVPIIGLLFLARHRKAVLASIGTAIALYSVNAAILGWSWVSTWLDQVGPFLETDAEVNAANSVSPVGFLQALLGVDSTIAVGLGGAATIAVVVVLARIWWRRDPDLSARMAITAPGLLLLSPHALFYDAGLIVLTTLVLIDRGRVDWRFAPALWLLGLTHLGRGFLDATPYAVVVAAVFVAAVTRLWAPVGADQAPLAAAV